MPDRSTADAGFITIQYVWVIATSLILFTLVANVVLVQYGRGIVRSALDDGVRAGARVTSSPAEAEATCEAVAGATRRDLLGGRLGDGITIDCLPAAGEMRAIAAVTFASWLPGVPDWSFSDEAVAVQEREP